MPSLDAEAPLTRIELSAALSQADTRRTIVLEQTGRWICSDTAQGAETTVQGTISINTLKQWLHHFYRASAAPDHPTAAASPKGFWFVRVYIADIVVTFRTGPIVPAAQSSFRTTDAELMTALSLPGGLFTA